MTFMNSTLLNTWIFVLNCFIVIMCNVHAEPQHVFLEEHCGNELSTDASILLVVGNWSSLPVDHSCYISFRLQTHFHSKDVARGQVSVLSVSLPGPPCTQGRVDVISSDNVTLLSEPGGICGSTFKGKFASSHDLVFINVTSEDKEVWGYLDILISSFNTDVCDTSHEFACDNGRCVSASVQCDGYDDCGDDSDETDGCLMSTLVIVVIVCVSAFVVIVVVIVLVLAVKRRWRMQGWGTGPTTSSLIGSINEDSEDVTTQKPIHYYTSKDSYGTMTTEH
ncbi:uncharacterized protein LOC106012386 [Aplysia californica]|uniref:Uncharacterized protein LOC106012386 n=1 Tax=Aplysia californica TaxID=6500 RepID=A0ABM1A4I9_APLCA|nr:uncharacterized protein LOC106012386 [Aplysia californica]